MPGGRLDATAHAFAPLDGSGPSPAELGRRGATRITSGPGLQRRATEALRGIAAGRTERR
ncbi:hypothetical protein [Streptomyces sp. NPDC047706]|uniref:hypothetical protein n=1 Tax=Streptomyces sp. NPDC047706 TaxID=3365486 RepID=UPI003724AEEC